MDQIDFQELKDMIRDARRAMEKPQDLTEVQEVSAALFFSLGIFIDNLADRVKALEESSRVARLVDASGKPMVNRPMEAQ